MSNIIFTLIVPLLVYLLYLASRRGKTPTNWPVIGMMPTVFQNLDRVHDLITDILSESGGTFELKGPWFCNLDMLFTSDPANINHILSKNFSNYPKGPEFYKIFDIFGNGFFRSELQVWEMHRRTVLSHFTHPKFAGTVERAVWDKVKTGLFPVLDNFCNRGADFDLQDIFHRFTYDNICKLVFDYDPCSLSVELPHVPSEKAFSSLDQSLFYRHIIPESIWKLQKRLKVGSEKKLMEAWAALDEFIYEHVNDESDFSLMETYKKAYYQDTTKVEESLSVFLRDAALSLMIAGKDTTGTCLTWLFWLLAVNPSAVIKIREEIVTQLMDEDKKLRFFNGEESKKLVYLHGALCESLRLFPPPPLEHKSALESDVLPSGHHVRKGAKMIMSIYAEGRMESVWGKDCLEFKPERWITPTGGIKHEPSYKLAAFHAGPRTCMGKDVAFLQMKAVAAAIIHRYNIQLVEPQSVSPLFSIILHTKHGLSIVLSKRKY